MYLEFSKKIYAPPVEIQESKDGYRILMELPGSLRDDIKVWAEDGILTITGEKKAPISDSEEKTSRLVAERVFGKLSRSFQLPKDADTSKIEANFDNGVLTVEIPKSEKAKPKDIEIN